MALTYGTVTGIFGDTSPSDIPVTGTVTFTPDAAWLLSEGLVTLPTPVTASLVNGAFSVELVATDDAALNPTDWTYEVSFSLKMGGQPWSKRPINIKVPAGQVTDLATVVPVAASEGNAILKGDTGEQGIQGIQGVQGIQGEQGIQGVKGDPGGIVAASTLAAGQDLNALTEPGTYRALSANATLELNFPKVGLGCIIMVLRNTSTLITQTIYPLNVTTQRVIWQRNLVGTVWSPWYAMASSRVDQTAGRAIYQWDDVNNREQMVYGDTGWRNIIMQSVSQTGNLHIRRTGQLVTVNAVGYSNTAASAIASNYGIFFTGGQVPGFTPGITARAVCTTAAGSARIIDVVPGTAEMRIFDGAVGTYSWSMTWPTNDAWPTALPGIAVGNIPNV